MIHVGTRKQKKFALKRKRVLLLASYLMLVGNLMAGTSQRDTITTGSLLSEMADMKRLTKTPLSDPYKTIQFSSFDRSSVSPDQPGWFSNSDGFGGATAPAFEKVLAAPDKNGVGTYLVCDVQQPGAIVRLWTAKHTGTIRMYLDGAKDPVFNGPAEDFYWLLHHKLSGGLYKKQYDEVFRQYDAVYFPIAFQKGCRIEWTGNTKEVHFYHVNLRVYQPGTLVKTFSPADYTQYQTVWQTTYNALKNPQAVSPAGALQTASIALAPQTRKDVLVNNGARSMDYFSVKLKTKKPEQVLRQAVLAIYCDNAAVPQVYFPLGDFFGAAPGINPYESLPFTVKADGTMECRFPMPFKNAIRIELENQSDEAIEVTANASFSPYAWIEDQSMYFYARWKIDHGIHASPNIVQDVPFLMARGKGRFVGASSLLFNPSPIPTGHGNWWGEGDEKIFVDDEKFPSFFGTGSEDYYNYSWSNEKIFFHPYCGQPRDDGPSTRGFVTNFRWHIIDDIPFNKGISFAMELFSHTEVPDMTYARGAYFYALPGVVTDLVRFTPDHLRKIKTPKWKPLATEGAAGVKFTEAEKMIDLKKAGVALNHHYIWSDSTLVQWTPKQKGEKIKLRLPVIDSARAGTFALTMGMVPDGGKFKTYFNGKPLTLDGKEYLDLKTEGRTMLRTFWAVGVGMKKGVNELELEFAGDQPNNKIGIDFFWLKNP